ncbi:MAG: hypothetical protein KDD13_03965, partial [Mangrovimonas sp.]|nr:hypothetical protein [Mangrovimonas sp.]
MAIRLILRGILLFVLITVVSCKQFDSNSQVDEGKIVNNIYTSDEIGWAMKIPDGWDVNKKSQSNKRNEV